MKSLRTIQFQRFAPNHSKSRIGSTQLRLSLQTQTQHIRLVSSSTCIHSHSTFQASPSHILDILSSRSLLQSTTSRAVRQHLGPEPSSSTSSASSSTPRTIYSGVDPSAPSLHVGNLLPLMALLWLAKQGHKIIVVIGGATGAIGDPSGRSSERNSLSPEQLQHNVSKITAQVLDFFERAAEYDLKRTGIDQKYDIRVVNNLEWYQGMGILNFLSKVGKFARVGVMMARDSVKSRLIGNDSTSSADVLSSSINQTSGLSFTEFSYQLLQAYDFHVLNSSSNCTIQIGGSDQLGNIMAGIDLIRRLKLQDSPTSNSNSEASTSTTTSSESSASFEAYGLTLPLLTTSSGQKFGKSAGNAIWLDKSLLSDYDFFQFFKRCKDEDLGIYFRCLTGVDLRWIEKLEDVVSNGQQQTSTRDLNENLPSLDPYVKNSAQTFLATEITELVRGSQAVHKAKVITSVLFDSDIRELSIEEIEDAFGADDRLRRFGRDEILGVEITRAMNLVGGTKSRGEATRLLKAGGLFLNNTPVKQDRTLTSEDLIKERFFVLRSGKVGHQVVLLDT